MLKSLSIYSKYFSKTLLNEEKRALLNTEWSRYNNDKQGFIAAKEIRVDDYQRIKSLYLSIEWLLRSQYYMKDYGFGSYRLTKGWTASYPETTGYIIPTLLNYGIEKNEKEIKACCIRAADWLLEIQKPSGGWQGETLDDNKPEIVFNTGQIIRGLISVYKYSNELKYLDASIKAANWLCEIQEKDGSWIKNAYLNVARVYDSYVDVPLLYMFEITGNEKYKNAAIKNLEWILNTKQQPNGWFADCDNTIKRNDNPILHTIAYTIDGLLDAGIILEREDFVNAAKKAANKLLDIYNNNGYLNGRYDCNWQGHEDPIITGYAQMAIIWMKLYKLTKNKSYLNSAFQMNRQLFWLQWDEECPVEAIRGSLSGSFPLWGKYEPFSFPNWGTKYFVDAIILEIELTAGEV